MKSVPVPPLALPLAMPSSPALSLRPSARHGFLPSLLFRPVDIAPLVVFRVVFGFLLFVESIGAIAIGFVHEAYIEPRFHFTYIDVPWLTPLPGYGMVLLYAAMGVFSLGVMLGYRYRLSCALLLGAFTYGFLLEQAHYINHHYLIILYGFLLCFMPANRYASLDARANPEIRREAIPAWPIVLLASQMAVVYLFAAFAKLNPDWLAALPLKAWFEAKTHYPVLGRFLEMEVMPWVFAYGGIAFDLFIVPAMLWWKTRKAAFALAVVFHLMNLATFLIGIFPFLAIAATALFFPPDAFRRAFFPEKAPVTASEGRPLFPVSRPVVLFCIAWLTIQVVLPLRPYLYEGDPAWTEAGHRYAWRMMLRAKAGTLLYTVHFQDGTRQDVDPGEFLTDTQSATVSIEPEMLWRMAGFLEEHFEEEGRAVEAVTANSQVTLNGREYTRFVDPDLDLTEYEWRRFRVPPWLKPAPE